MSKIPVFIICRDRLLGLQRLMAFLQQCSGVSDIFLVDNASTYSPLLGFLAGCKHVVRLETNEGPYGVWRKNLLPKDQEYVVTDSDVVPDERCPKDVVQHLGNLLPMHWGRKAGLGLRIDDLPDHYSRKNEVIAWETPFWQRQLSPGVFDAPIDTTFARYRVTPGGPRFVWQAVRTGPPYVAQHLSWYEDSAHPTDEALYYRVHVDPRFTSWERPGRLQRPEVESSKEWLEKFERFERDDLPQLSSLDSSLVKQEHARFRALIAQGHSLRTEEMAGHQMWKNSLLQKRPVKIR